MKTMTMYRPAAIQNALGNFDKYFESFFGDSILSPITGILNQMPAVDIQENENTYVLEMDLPGYDEKNIHVNVDRANLTIAYKMEDEKKNDENQGDFLIRERCLSSFSRSFKLPENADSEAVNAAYKNGILKLEIKKRAEAQKRIIQINAA